MQESDEQLREDSMEQSSTLLVLDFSQLRNVTLNDEALMREVVCALVSDASHQIKELNMAMERSDASACVRVAHCAQGACGNVGAASLAALFFAVEQQARAGDLTRCQSSMEYLHIELEKLRSEAFSM
jgi:HPt (histidine-containing phosphotransfer) domain-containing protein